MKRIRKVAVVSPSVMLSERSFNTEKWLAYLQQDLGLEVVLMPTALGGTKLETFQARDKACDIMAAYADDSIDALLAVHGGASALRVLEYLDFEVIKKHPKPVIGFSDTTSLQFGVFGKTGQAYITGFLPEYDFRDGRIAAPTDEDLRRVLAGEKFAASSGVCVHPGVAEGVLIGGNVSTISDLSGTPYYPDLNGKILLLDVPLAALQERLKSDTQRPLLQRPDRREFIAELHAKRMPLYEAAADLVVPAGAPGIVVARRILELLGEQEET